MCETKTLLLLFRSKTLFRAFARAAHAARSTCARCLVNTQAFTHNGVQFKVVATEPQSGPGRVAANTTIFSEGRLHPSAAELLTPDQARQLAIFPPGLQLLLLHTNMYGNGEMGIQ